LLEEFSGTHLHYRHYRGKCLAKNTTKDPAQGSNPNLLKGTMGKTILLVLQDHWILVTLVVVTNENNARITIPPTLIKS